MRNFPIKFVTFFFSSLVMEKFIYLSINVSDKNANANANKKNIFSSSSAKSRQLFEVLGRAEGLTA